MCPRTTRRGWRATATRRRPSRRPASRWRSPRSAQTWAPTSTSSSCPTSCLWSPGQNRAKAKKKPSPRVVVRQRHGSGPPVVFSLADPLIHSTMKTSLRMRRCWMKRVAPGSSLRYVVGSREGLVRRMGTRFKSPQNNRLE